MQKRKLLPNICHLSNLQPQSHSEFRVLHIHPPGSTLRQFYVRNCFLISQSKSKVNDYTLWEKRKQNQKTLLFFQLSVSRTTVQVLLNNMYFPLLFLAPPLQYSKKYPNPSFHSLSDLIWNLCVHRTYTQSKTTISDILNHYRNTSKVPEFPK